ncbi:MAG TPA: MerR family transcriptional regulator [Ktedonobacterales bacterium]|jgi:DNA-binding transcriptional MerR regulator
MLMYSSSESPWKSLDPDVTSPFILPPERRKTLNQRFYQSGQFAKKAAVSVRALRFYDRLGLLQPSAHTEAGYRLYTDADFFRLQQILALKFLGFALEEIKYCLQVGPTSLKETLALQKAMMQEKRARLESVIQAISETEPLLQGNGHDWEAIIHVIQVMHMEQTNDWRKKYFTDEQLKQMEELSKQSYSEEARQKLAEWGKNWTEADQERANQQWAALIAELKRLVASSQDPAGSEAQALAGQWMGMIQQFTRGDTDVLEGVKKMTSANLRGQTPYPPFFGKEDGAFLDKMLETYQERQGA